MFTQSKKAKIWHSIDLTAAAQAINQPRLRLVKALSYLEEQEYITLQATGVRQGYRFVNRPQNISQTSAKLYSWILEQERRNLAKVDNVINLVGWQGCQGNYLLNYFGEQRKSTCGHCSWCLQDKTTSKFSYVNSTPFSSADRQLIKELSNDSRISQLTTARQLTRFLCGVSSPFIAKYKLKSHPRFGRYNDVPFKEVLKLVETELSS